MSSNSTKKPVTVQVESEMIENLIKYLQNYNGMMSYKSQTDQHNSDLLEKQFVRKARICSTGTESYVMLLNGEEVSSEALTTENLTEKGTNKSMKRGY